MNFPDFGIGPVEQNLWTLLFLSIRCGAAMFAAPLFGGLAVPVQLRAVFSLALGVFVFNWVPYPALPEMLSIAGFVAVVQEAVIGFALGFVLQLSFAVPLIAGEQIAGTMGLAMAATVDPATGTHSNVLGQYFSIMLTLIFLMMGAHLLWFQLVIESYHALPIGGGAFTALAGQKIVGFAGTAFATAVAIALPVVMVLLLVQFANGVLSRSAPSLNLFALGLPAGVLAGIAALIMALPVLTEQLTQLSLTAVEQVGQLVQP